VLLGIDHLVIAVCDPDAAAAELERTLGLAFTGGGRHELAGTFNRLAFLGDTYLELIGVFDHELVLSNPEFAVGRAALELLDAGREGLVTFALASDDIVTDVVRLRGRGSWIGEPVPGSRRRPDGGVVRWLTAFPVPGSGAAPFLIEHAADDAEWNAGARAERAMFHHPVGGRVRLAVVELPVADPPAVAADYAATVGMAFGDAWTATLGGQAIRLRVANGTPPLVELTADVGTPRLDVERFGVCWRRRC
jgi:hypothetical protein